RLLEPALQPVEPGRPELRDRHHGVVLRHCRRSEQHRSYGCDDGQGPPRDFHTSSFRWYCCQARPPGRGDALACSDQANSPMTPSRLVWRRCISAIETPRFSIRSMTTMSSKRKSACSRSEAIGWIDRTSGELAKV